MPQSAKYKLLRLTEALVELKLWERWPSGEIHAVPAGCDYLLMDSGRHVPNCMFTRSGHRTKFLFWIQRPFYDLSSIVNSKDRVVLMKGMFTICYVGKTASMSMLILSLNQDIHWREGTALVMLTKLLLWVCLLSMNQDIHWREGNNIGNVGKTDSMSMLTLFESRYTLKGR